MILEEISRLVAAFLATAAWGVVHFITAIPAGRGMGLPVPLAALAALAGYAAITAVVVLAGDGFRKWLAARFSIRFEPDPSKLLWRVWLRAGLPGLGLLAPVTCGPYIAAVIALGLGERPLRTWTWISIGVVPWALTFALLTSSL